MRVFVRADGSLAKRCRLHGGQGNSQAKTPEGKARQLAGAARGRIARWAVRTAQVAEQAAEAKQAAQARAAKVITRKGGDGW